MRRATVVAAIAGALVALVVVASLAALDRTVLHIYTAEDVATASYYVDEDVAVSSSRTYGTKLPPCKAFTRLGAIPGSHDDPKFHSGRALLECIR